MDYRKYVKKELVNTVEMVDDVLSGASVEPPEMVQAKASLLNVRRSALDGIIKALKIETEIEINKQKLEKDEDDIKVKIEIIGEET